MDIAIKCFVCHVKTDDWRNELVGLKSQHSSTFVTYFIKKILGDFQLIRNIDDESNCICADCLNRFEEYDWTCTMMQQYEKELYDLLVKTDALCCSKPKENADTTDTETKTAKKFGDPLTDSFAEQPSRNDDLDDDDDLLKVMVEPLNVPIPKDKQSDDELPNNEQLEPLFNEELDSGAVTHIDNPDFDCKAEGDDSSFDDNEDDDYVPQKRKIKLKKSRTVTNIKMEQSGEYTPKKRGRKPKIKDGEEERKPRKKREKKSYECKDCEKVFEKLVDFVVELKTLIFYTKLY